MVDSIVLWDFVEVSEDECPVSEVEAGDEIAKFSGQMEERFAW